MSDIFISHAVADKALAKLLVDFLKEAIGVPASAIFCSSMKGHHIGLGEDFNAYLYRADRSQIAWWQFCPGNFLTSLQLAPIATLGNWYADNFATLRYCDAGNAYLLT